MDNRLHGWIVAIMELSLFFLPISIIQYMVSYCSDAKLQLPDVKADVQACSAVQRLTPAQAVLSWMQPTYFYGALLVSSSRTFAPAAASLYKHF